MSSLQKNVYFDNYKHSDQRNAISQKGSHSIN